MKVAVIENRLKDYVIDIFNRHQDAQIDLISFLDWKPQQDQYQEISIDRIEELDNGQYDIVLIAIKENRYLSRLLTYLHKKHIQNVYIVRLFALDMREDFLDETQPMYLDRAKVDSIPKENEKPYLVHLETHVCDHCNLNCKACNNFSPFVKEPSYADIDQFERDLKRLTELFTGIGRFFLLGGEPLLAPELCCEMIRCYRKYFPTNELRVLTNATLILSMKDEFWDCVRENDVIIHISLYPPVKERIDEIRERLESEKVRYIVFKEVETFAKHWTAYPFEDEKFNNERCGSAGCHYLRNGEISKCPDAMLVDFMVDGNAELKSLGLNDRENLLQVNNAWELIEKIDNPIDLCKKCTYKRLKPIKWERVDGEAQSSDWLLPHWYEFEIENLKCANDKAKDEIRKLKGTVETLNNEKEILSTEKDIIKCEKEILSNENQVLKEKVEYQNKEIEILQDGNKDKDCELKLKEEEISEYDLRVKELNKEVNVWRTKYNNTNSQLHYAQQEYQRINVSYSHKIGRCITWLPRKIREKTKSIRERVKRKIKQSGIYTINNIFRNEVLKGLEEYGMMINKYGSDVNIFFTAWRGTGDYYICGMYLQEYLIANKIDNYVFLIPNSGGEKKVVELFEVYDSHTMIAGDRTGLIVCNSFLPEIPLIYHLHHGLLNIKNPSISVSNAMSNYVLAGYNGLNMVDFYLYCGFNLPEKANKSSPRFDKDDNRIDLLFKENNLVKDKTVLLSPYSTGLKQYEIPIKFWSDLAKVLKNRGYSVATNCVGAEKCIRGTNALNIPYSQTVPFLEKAGYFIGIRSGLCDIISSARCKKIVIHTFKARWWPDGNSILYTGLNNMGFCDDAIEFEYKNDDSISFLLEQTLKYMN